jgi:hypothetical protein
MIQQTITNNLEQLKAILFQISKAQFTQLLPVLHYSTIGMHIRHIIEFYQCLLEAETTAIVDYDSRKRNIDLETNPQECIAAIDMIINDLQKNARDFPLQLSVNYSLHEGESILLKTTFQRELLYNIEHTVHHMAIIKIGIKDLKADNIAIDEHFGVAISTIRNKKACVQ